jgi:uncharacterized membrane-anchored protein YitT (DUF2179 family)
MAYLYNIEFKQLLKDFILIIIGIFAASFGLKGFLLANNFIDGGATGISLLITEITGYPIYYLIFLINIPFIVLAYFVLGKTFSIKTVISIFLFSTVLALVSFPVITNDKLLVAIFGGFFLGAGIGFSIRGGAVLDGTEVLAIFLSRKFGLKIGDFIIILNLFIFICAAYFLGIESSLYSMITYLAASKTVDFVLEGFEEYIWFNIITSEKDKMTEFIVNEMGYGVSVHENFYGYGNSGRSENISSIFTIVSRLEVNKLNQAVKQIDDSAFVIMHNVKDINGGKLKKRKLKH